MFAVIKTGGKQYKVAANDRITVEKLEGTAGSAVTFSDVLMIGAEVGAPTLAGAAVTGEIIEQTRSAKTISFFKRRRQNSKRKRGHRQELTVIRIDGIYREHIQKLLDLAREGKRLTIVMPWGESDPRPQFVPSMVMPMLELPFTMMNMFVPSMVRETFLRFPVMKAKSPKRAEPESGRDLTELLSGLRTSFETTRLLLEGLLPANAERVALIHPVFGRNTIPDILGLMTAHERRHQAQMAALLRDPRFPKS